MVRSPWPGSTPLHTFISDGPGFRTPVLYETGSVLLRDQRIAFCDLV